ncbi:hypothetical protein L345_06990, partial [Ophiophagus hannah]
KGLQLNYKHSCQTHFQAFPFDEAGCGFTVSLPAVVAHHCRTELHNWNIATEKLIGFVYACYVISVFMEEEDSNQLFQLTYEDRFESIGPKKCFIISTHIPYEGYLPSLTKKSARKNVTFIDTEECGMPIGTTGENR